MTTRISWVCPTCGTEVHIKTKSALRRAQKSGKCHGCQVAETFRRATPLAISAMLDFWVRYDCWPESDSWMKAAIEMGYWKVAG